MKMFKKSILCDFKLILTLFYFIQNTISDQNQAPRFDPPLQSNYFFPEFNSTKPGDTLMWLNASDADDDYVKFNVEGNFYNKLFSIKQIDGKHAVVIANQIFDRESQEKYENIVFSIQDKPGNKVHQSVRFVILDIDDNRPIFKNTPYKISVYENHPLDTNIFDQIEAYDVDGPLNNKFSFSLVNKANEDEYFSIEKTIYLSSGHYKSSIVLRKKLDYQKLKTHVITILAIGENSKLMTSTELLVNVIDFPNKKPEFIQSPYYVRIDEEMQMGAFVLKISANDGDTGINNPCKYKILNEDNSNAADYFSIDSLTGVLTIKQRIDLELEEISRMGGLLEFKVEAFEIGDENSIEQTQIIISINDINDNQPKFNKESFELNISPRSTVGTSLTLLDSNTDSIRVTDFDKGINGSFSLKLVKVREDSDVQSSSTTFEFLNDYEVVPKLALNDANIIIKLKNAESIMKKIGAVEHYKLFAKDNGLNGNITSVDITIKIDSINQYAPQFENEIYMFYVDENAPYNTTVGILHASDNDTFEQFGKVYYELKNGQDRFQIDKNTGRIFTISSSPSQQLDRELIDTFYMSVDAMDGGGLRTSVQLIIKLNDLNDNAPKLLNSILNANGLLNSTNNNNFSNFLVGYIEENSLKWLEPIHLQAVDRDIGKNGALIYEILDGDFLVDHFKINEKTNMIGLRDNLTLDFELLYKLHQEDVRFFSKSLPQLPGLTLNLDEMDINLIINVHDMGSPELSSKIFAKIIVKDINDHLPKFDKMYYSTKVLETTSFGEIFQVTAYDYDAPNTQNSKVNYRIENGGLDKFYIDQNSGVVRIKENSNLDRDLFGSFYTLKIVATDFGSIGLNKPNLSKIISNDPSANSLGNVCYLMIQIIDENNKAPEFSANLDTVLLSEGAPVNTVLTKIKAIDRDLDSKLVYFLVKNNNSTFTSEKFEAFDENQHPVSLELVQDWFDIDNNGTVFTKSKIDREIAEQITLIIGVEDTNASKSFKPQITTSILKVRLLDVNDNFPTFAGLKKLNKVFFENEEPIFEMYEKIEENSKVNTRITQLKATDIDKEKNITYSIIHSSENSNYLQLNKLTGEIYVGEKIDYEKVKWVNLTIIVFDNGTPRSKHCLLHFYCKVEDVNDNSPIFINVKSNEISVYENSLINTVVAKFKALDLDSGHFGKINYEILSGDDGKFGIDPESGILYIKSNIDREEQDLYTLVIQARDNPSKTMSVQQLSDSMLVKIRVLDINDNAPFCEKEFYSIETIQNVDENTNLVQVKGIDNDIGKNANLTYELNRIDTKDLGQNKELFRINQSNGYIQTNEKLVGYSGEFFYKIKIQDNGEEKSLSGNCTVRILIKVFNAHPPKFLYPNYKNSSIRIKSSLSIGSHILTINATDYDTGTNGEVNYYLDQKRVKNDDWKAFNLDPRTGFLTLNSNLNIHQQSVYSIDVVAHDLGKPMSLQSRLTLTIFLVDDKNNAAQFNRMQICLSGKFQCEKDYEAIIVKIKEEQSLDDVGFQLGLAKMNDPSKKEEDICYYLSGIDRKYFTLDKQSGVLVPKINFNREVREKYEVVVKASEYCSCRDELECKNFHLNNETFDIGDISQIKVKIILEDINDNAPKFHKNFYQIAISSDINYGETVLDSYVTDLDSNCNLTIKIQKSTLITNRIEKSFPFELESSESQTKLHTTKRFSIKTKQYFKEQQNPSNLGNPENIFYQFNMTTVDQDNLSDSTVIQVILINKQQRVKLVFSQPIEKVLMFQDEFQNFISNLTGFKAYVDKVNVHRSDEGEELDERGLTDMFLHFVSNGTLDMVNKNLVVDAEKILNLLDRSKDSNLLRKYKLSLAEKYDDQGTSTYYKYGSNSIDEEFGSFFLWQPSTKSYSHVFTRLVLIVILVILLILSVTIVAFCCCVKQKYKRKLKAERAMMKAFSGTLNRYGDASNPISYVNPAFEGTTNNLLPIPGTNLYAYEGSNPIWLKKYDKIDTKIDPSGGFNSSAASTSSSNSNEGTACCNRGTKLRIKRQLTGKNNEDISSFYLKQVDSPGGTSRSSPNSTDNKNHSNTSTSSDILSLQNISPTFEMKNIMPDNMSTFKTDTLLTFASNQIKNSDNFKGNTNVKYLCNNLNTSNNGNSFNFDPNNKSDLVTQMQTDAFLDQNSKNITKIFDSYQQQVQQIDKNYEIQSHPTTAKDYCDLFAVESTVI